MSSRRASRRWTINRLLSMWAMPESDPSTIALPAGHRSVAACGRLSTRGAGPAGAMVACFVTSACPARFLLLTRVWSKRDFRGSFAVLAIADAVSHPGVCRHNRRRYQGARVSGGTCRHHHSGAPGGSNGAYVSLAHVLLAAFVPFQAQIKTKGLALLLAAALSYPGQDLYEYMADTLSPMDALEALVRHSDCPTALSRRPHRPGHALEGRGDKGHCARRPGPAGTVPLDQ